MKHAEAASGERHLNGVKSGDYYYYIEANATSSKSIACSVSISHD
jgi:hypothetical protein